jgi:hypothetical protein
MRPSTASPHAVVAAYLLRPLSITFGQNVIVVDGSVLAVALGDGGTDGQQARARLADETLVAPELVDLEVVSVWRRHVAAKLMPARRAAGALGDLAVLPLRCMTLRILRWPRLWTLCWSPLMHVFQKLQASIARSRPWADPVKDAGRGSITEKG